MIKSFGVELSLEDVEFLKQAYNLETDGKVRNWLQYATDLLLERIKLIEARIRHDTEQGISPRLDWSQENL